MRAALGVGIGMGKARREHSTPTARTPCNGYFSISPAPLYILTSAQGRKGKASPLPPIAFRLIDLEAREKGRKEEKELGRRKEERN